MVLFILFIFKLVLIASKGILKGLHSFFTMALHNNFSLKHGFEVLNDLDSLWSYGRQHCVLWSCLCVQCVLGPGERALLEGRNTCSQKVQLNRIGQ